ncbi:MAG: hypothetical protein JST39_24180, partial [Bacteroidetes bacterium]|nr:hypothetical protein [Bacteroidota bacterium]
PGKLTILPVLLLLYTTPLFSRPYTLPADTGKSPCQLQAMQRLDEALALMQKHYYRKNGVQWDSLVTYAKNRLNNSSTCEEAFETIDWCFRQMHENHSFVMPPARAAEYNGNASPTTEKPKLENLVGKLEGILLDDGTGYINIPWVGTTDSLICAQVADSIQAIIARLDEKNIRKWIVDLRANRGGNCWPMLAGVGPLLGEGVCAYFVTNREKTPIIYKDGAAMLGRNIRCQSNRNYKTKAVNPKIAVLMGNRTCSAGEIVALAFRGKEQVSFYGSPTAGLTTGNNTYMLSDKSMLVLAISMEADRRGTICEGRLVPDEIVEADDRTHRDKVISRARMWLDIQ